MYHHPSQFPASTNTIYQTIQPTANNMNNNNAMVITHPFQPSTIDVQQHIKVYIFEKKKEEITSCLEEKDAQSIRRNIVSLAKFGYTELIQYITEKCGVNAEKAIIRYLDDENQWVDVSSEEEWKFAVQTFQSARKISHNRPVLKLAIVQIKSEEPKSQEQECPFVRCHRRRRAGVCPFKQQQHHRCPYLFRKDENTGDAVLELDVDVNDLKSGNILKNLDKVQMPHYGVTCDGCGEYAFVGRRFKCDQCPDFDFCEKCYETETSNHYGGNHSFTERIAPGRSYLNRLFDGQQQQPESSNTTPEEETVVDNQLYEKTVEVEPEVVAEEQPVSVEPVAVEQPQVVEEPEVVEPPVVVEQQVPVSRMPHPLNPVFIQSPTVPVQQPIIVPYSTELNLLKEMGFFDERRCLELLKKYNGDIQRVIVDLLH